MGKNLQNGKYEKSVKLKSAYWMGMCDVNLKTLAQWCEELDHNMIGGQHI